MQEESVWKIMQNPEIYKYILHHRELMLCIWTVQSSLKQKLICMELVMVILEILDFPGIKLKYQSFSNSSFILISFKKGHIAKWNLWYVSNILIQIENNCTYQMSFQWLSFVSPSKWIDMSRYNESQIRTRNRIEKLCGITRRRFPVIAIVTD